MSNQRPTDDEIRERIKVIHEAFRIGDDAGAPDSDVAMATIMTAEEVLLWVLGEDSRFDVLYQDMATLVRSHDRMRQQNFRLN